MSASKKTSVLPKNPYIVGTIPTPGALKIALRLKNGRVDYFELRVDHFAADPDALRRATAKLQCPLIVTVRHPAEGGSGNLSFARRRELYAAFLDRAAFIDVELRSMASLKDTVAAARSRGIKVIGSVHYFKSIPSEGRLREQLQKARDAGVDVFKVAALTRTVADVLSLARLLVEHPQVAISAMGMGPFGKLSRVLLAEAGSVFNYGYLDTVQVPGQWPAPLLKERLAELR